MDNVKAVPQSAAQPARREALAREAARRQAVATLRLASAVAAYAAGQISNGLGPEQAGRAALDAAGELAGLAALLRQLTLARPDLDPAGRRALALRLAADGVSQREIARRVGRSERRVWDYLRGRV